MNKHIKIQYVSVVRNRNNIMKIAFRNCKVTGNELC